MKRIYYLILTIILIMPVCCIASENSFVLSCPSTASSDEEFTCKVIIKGDSIESYSASVSPSSGMTLVGSGTISGSSANDGDTIGTVKIKGTKSGEISVSGKINDTTVSGSNGYVTIANTSEITNILVNNSSIGFNKNTKEYNLKLDSTDGTFKVKAEGCDATYKSSDTIKINEGEKGFVTVTCGSVSYKLNITRNDSRNSDSSLKTLMIGDKEIELSEGKYEYELSVPNKTKKVTVTAKANNSKATVEGTKDYELAVGENKITVVVTAENNEESTYKIIVTRKEVVDSSKENLKSLTINDLKIKKISSDMFLTLANEVDKINLEYELEDEDSEVSFDENTNLKVGLNKVPVTITDSNDKKTKYTLYIFKEAEKNIVDNDEDEIIKALEDGDVYVKLKSSDDKIVSKEILKKLNGNKITYEVIGDNDMILYSVSFSGKKFESYNKDINFELVFNTKKSILKSDNYFNVRFVNDTYLPASVVVNIFIQSKFKNNQSLYLYSYDGSKELKLLDDSVKKKDYYVSFKTDHLGELVLSDEEIIIKDSKTLIIIIIVASIVLVAGIITFVIIKKKKGKGKKKKVKTIKQNITKENVVNNIQNNNVTNKEDYNIDKTPHINTESNLDDEFSDLLNNDFDINNKNN